MSGNMERILRLMADKGASDIYLSANMPVLIRINGQMLQLSDQLLTPSQPRQLIAEVLDPKNLAELDESGELNMAVSISKVGSFRLSAFRQRGTIAAVFRHIPHIIPSLDSLNLPPILSKLVMEKRGLILMVGATGTGKSTTLAAMLEQRNMNMAGHILTIEDPVEFLFSNKRSVVNQREVGRDTASLHVALKNALRQSPDCILIGEIRDRETMTAAISYALSGHLVLATLHANNCAETMDRIINMFPRDQHNQIFLDLSQYLKAIAAQRLVFGKDGKRVAAVEVMMNTPHISELIKKGDVTAIKEAIVQSSERNVQSFDAALYELVKSGRIELEEALNNADSRTNLEAKINFG